jgi:hypothetical protein
MLYIAQSYLSGRNQPTPNLLGTGKTAKVHQFSIESPILIEIDAKMHQFLWFGFIFGISAPE